MVYFNVIEFFKHGLSLGHLISHRAHRVRTEKSKKLCDLCGLCERMGKTKYLSEIQIVEIITNLLNPDPSLAG